MNMPKGGVVCNFPEAAVQKVKAQSTAVAAPVQSVDLLGDMLAPPAASGGYAAAPAANADLLDLGGMSISAEPPKQTETVDLLG